MSRRPVAPSDPLDAEIVKRAGALLASATEDRIQRASRGEKVCFESRLVRDLLGAVEAGYPGWVAHVRRARG